VYTLPLYHPLRLAEEICTLTRLSGGRLELASGRRLAAETASLPASTGRSASHLYFEAFQVLMQALTSRSRELRRRALQVR